MATTDLETKDLVVTSEAQDPIMDYKEMLDAYLTSYLGNVGKPGVLTHGEEWARKQAFDQGVLSANLDRTGICEQTNGDLKFKIEQVFNYLQDEFSEELKLWALEKPAGFDLDEDRKDPRIKTLREMELNLLNKNSHE